MAQVKPFKFDSDGFPIEIDTAADDLTVNSLTVDSGIAMGASKITGLLAGTAGTDAVNLEQLDAVSAGIDYKNSCRAATTAAHGGTFAAGGGANGKGQITGASGTIDGVTLAQGDRVLVKSEGAADLEHGIYEVTATTTTWDRADDFDDDAEVTSGATTWIEEGTVNGSTRWTLSTADPITVNTTAIDFIQTASAVLTGGDGIDITGSVVSVDLATDPGLEFATGELRALVNPAGAIERVAAGLGVILEASNPSLQISANELGIKLDPAGAIVKGAAGTAVQVDGSTITINGSNQLVAAVDEWSATAGTGGVTIGDPLYVSADDTVLPADNANNNTRKYVGVAKTTEVATAAVVVQQSGVLAGVTVAGSPAAGDLVYLDTTDGLTVTLPTGSGTHRLVVGKMKNANDLIIEPQYLGKIA